MSIDDLPNSEQAVLHLAMVFFPEERFTGKDLHAVEKTHEMKLVNVAAPREDELESLSETEYVDSIEGEYKLTDSARETKRFDEAEKFEPEYRRTITKAELASGEMSVTGDGVLAEIDDVTFSEGEAKLVEDGDGTLGLEISISGPTYRTHGTTTVWFDDEDQFTSELDFSR